VVWCGVAAAPAAAAATAVAYEKMYSFFSLIGCVREG